jgi:hypothetical protein
VSFELVFIFCHSPMQLLFVLLIITILCLQGFAQDIEVDTGISFDATTLEDPWFRAASLGDLATVQNYLAHGYHINEQDRTGWTAAIFATMYGHKVALELVRVRKHRMYYKSNPSCFIFSFIFFLWYLLYFFKKNSSCSLFNRALTSIFKIKME